MFFKCLYYVLNAALVAGVLPDRDRHVVPANGYVAREDEAEPPGKVSVLTSPRKEVRALLRRDDGLGSEAERQGAVTRSRSSASSRRGFGPSNDTSCPQTDGMSEFYEDCVCGEVKCDAKKTSFCYVDMEAGQTGVCLPSCKDGEVGPCTCGHGNTSSRALCLTKTHFCDPGASGDAKNKGQEKKASDGVATCKLFDSLKACDNNDAAASVPCLCHGNTSVDHVCTSEHPYCYKMSNGEGECRHLLKLPHCHPDDIGDVPCHCGTNETACTSARPHCYNDTCLAEAPTPAPTVETPEPTTLTPTRVPTAAPTVSTDAPTPVPTTKAIVQEADPESSESEEATSTTAAA